MSTAIERLCCEWLGYPPFVFADGAGGEPLRLTIYKDPLAVPLEVFQRLGAERDEARLGAAFDVSGALLFDADEREAMRFQAYELCARAIDAGDLDLARRHAMLSKTEWYPGHHFGRDLLLAPVAVEGHEHHRRAVRCAQDLFHRRAVGDLFGEPRHPVEDRHSVVMRQRLARPALRPQPPDEGAGREARAGGAGVNEVLRKPLATRDIAESLARVLRSAG